MNPRHQAPEILAALSQHERARLTRCTLITQASGSTLLLRLDNGAAVQVSGKELDVRVGRMRAPVEWSGV